MGSGWRCRWQNRLRLLQPKQRQAFKASRISPTRLLRARVPLSSFAVRHRDDDVDIEPSVTLQLLKFDHLVFASPSYAQTVVILRYLVRNIVVCAFLHAFKCGCIRTVNMILASLQFCGPRIARFCSVNPQNLIECLLVVSFA